MDIHLILLLPVVAAAIVAGMVHRREPRCLHAVAAPAASGMIAGLQARRDTA
jgi:hypothetical protein